MATADKTSLKNKRWRDFDYFSTIAFCWHSILWTNYTYNGPVGGAIELNIENETFPVRFKRCR